MAKIYFLEDMLLIPRYFFCVLFFFCSNCGVSQANILVSTRSCATPLTKNPMFYIVSKQVGIKYHNFFYYYYYHGCPGQLVRTSTNPTGPEVNDHVSLQ